jgi:hypothetical protein
MSIRPCHLCGQRVRGKLASLYWAWYLADNTRVAWRQNLCVGCLSEAFATLLKAASASEQTSETCPNCGGSNKDDLDPLFAVLYLPQQEQREFELELDAACAAKVRLLIIDQGDRLTDRSGSGRGPTPPSDNRWAELGL